ncbi:MAG: PKD domain-containing protein, partial [Bacteroidota bacterium]|nr:PKD domain-containing protein [Bacteroidota bacterium]
ALGCVDSISYDNVVKISVLTADFDFTKQACLGSPISYTNKSIGFYNTSIWDFGDGAPPVKNTSGQYIYKDTGLYTVRLFVQDTVGCKDSIEKIKAIQVSKPVAAFTVNDSISFCPPFEVHFTNNSKFIGNLDWTFSNYGTSKENDPKIVLTNPGTYNVKLKVLSPDGNCADSAFKNITLHKPEDARLTYNPLTACIPGTVTLSAFDNLASAKFFWDFGDGNILDTAVNLATHIYTDFGTFTPKIILTESSGCVTLIGGTEPIKIHGVKTKIDIDKFFFCDSGYIKTVDSTVFNEPVSSYAWNFGDGTIDNNVIPPGHRYSNPGIYPVSLTVTTVTGCTSTMKLPVPIKIVQSPLISIAGDSIICVNELLQHSGVFERPDTSVVRWAWQFPNGNNASVQVPKPQRYQMPGRFSVSTIATNTSGCADTVIKNILVNPLPTVILPGTINKQAGFPVTIPAKYTSNVVSYNWSPAVGLSCTDCPEPIVTTKFDTKYKVSFIDSNGCKNTGEVQIIVFCKNANVFVPNTFSPNGDGSNDVFYVRGKGLERIKSLRVFNRWGEIVFEKSNFAVNDPSVGWDGRYKDAKPQPDVYIYQLEVFCENSQVISFEGNIALIK